MDDRKDEPEVVPNLGLYNTHIKPHVNSILSSPHLQRWKTATASEIADFKTLMNSDPAQYLLKTLAGGIEKLLAYARSDSGCEKLTMGVMYMIKFLLSLIVWCYINRKFPMFNWNLRILISFISSILVWRI